MSSIIPSSFPKSNFFNHSPNRVCTRSNKDHYKRPSLPPIQFKEANLQKMAWIKASIQEGGLRGNELIVVEAVAFLTDPVYGKGTPSIGAIQEQCLKKTSSIHRDTVSQCLKRLVQKGVITSEFRGVKRTNLFTLVGFEYKSESCYRDSRHNINSLPPLKGEGKGSKSKDNKIPDAQPIGGAGNEEKEQKADPEIAKRELEEMRRILRAPS